MNIRNLFGLKYLALMLLAAFTFTSCEEDEFTAEEAYALEEQRLQLLDQFEQDRRQQEFDNEMAMRRFQRTIDSLTQANSGGRVLYTAVFVPGESSVFTSGRLEEAEGLAGITVTAEQYGITTTATTDNAGVASFLLYSGEVTINGTVASYTDVNYVSNLTPDGGVPNGGTAHVGNVIPMFFNDAAAADAQDRMAMIAGRFFAETDATNFQEEVMTSAGTSDGKSYLAGTPGAAAFIDTRTGSGFFDEYLGESVDEGFNTDGDITGSGQINRIAYETAGAIARPDANGDYSMMVPATGSGLQMRMEFSEFVAEQTFYSDDDFNNPDANGFAQDARVLFTQDGTATNHGLDFSFLFSAGGFLLPTDAVLNTVNFTVAPASITAEIVAGDALVDGGSFANPLRASAWAGFTAGFPSAISGAYVVRPTLSFATPTGGTAATGVANMDYSAPLYANTSLYGLDDINITSGGSGYGARSSRLVTVNRQQTGMTGTGVISVSTNGLTPDDGSPRSIRVIEGGSGFRTSEISNTIEGRWTGLTPILNLPTGVDQPSGLGNLTATFYYDEGTYGTSSYFATTAVTTTTAYSPTTNNAVFGTVERATIQGQPVGNFSEAQLLQLANPLYVAEAAVFPPIDAEGDFLFLVDPNAGNSLIFNPDYGVSGSTIGDVNGATAETQIDLTGVATTNGFSAGRGYVFVPGVSVVALDGAGTVAGTSLVLDANGTIQTISIGTTSGFALDAGATVTVDGDTYNEPQNNIRLIVATQGPDLPLVLEVVSAEGEGGVVASYTVTENRFSSDYVAALDEMEDETNDAFAIYTNPSVNLDPTDGATTTAQENTYYVQFDAPAAGGQAATGYPVFTPATIQAFGAPTPDYSSAEMIGINLVESGNGYAAGEAPGWTLLPVGAVDATGIADVATSYIQFSIGNGGTYALTPQIRVYGDQGFSYLFQEVTPRMNPDGSIRDIGVLNFVRNRVAIDVIPNGVGYQNAGDPIFATDENLTVVVDTDAQNDYASDILNGLLTEATVDAGGYAYHLIGAATDAAPGTFGSIVALRYFRNDDNTFDDPELLLDVEDDELWNDEDMYPDGAEAVQFAGANAGKPSWIVPFTVNIDGLFGGTGAVATIGLDEVDGTYAGTTLTAGGANYVGNDAGFNEEFDAFGAQDFKVVGGNYGDAAGDFEVFTGLSYVRDIHYGTGILLE